MNTKKGKRNFAICAIIYFFVVGILFCSVRQSCSILPHSIPSVRCSLVSLVLLNILFNLSIYCLQTDLLQFRIYMYFEFFTKYVVEGIFSCSAQFTNASNEP